MLKLKNPTTVSLLSPTLTNSSHYSLTRGATITSLALLVTAWRVTVVTRRHHKGRSHHYSITIDSRHTAPGNGFTIVTIIQGNMWGPWRVASIYIKSPAVHFISTYRQLIWRLQTHSCLHFLSRVIRLTFLLTMAVARRQSSPVCTDHANQRQQTGLLPAATTHPSTRKLCIKSNKCLIHKIYWHENLNERICTKICTISNNKCLIHKIYWHERLSWKNYITRANFALPLH